MTISLVSLNVRSSPGEIQPLKSRPPVTLGLTSIKRFTIVSWRGACDYNH